MSFGFSVGDIITCSRLAAEIYDHCFTKAQGAGKFPRAFIRATTSESRETSQFLATSSKLSNATDWKMP